MIRRSSAAIALGTALALCGRAVLPATDDGRPRLRDLGIEPGILQPGPLNAITDVKDVLVGHRTLIEKDSIRTGVTAILPHGGNLYRRKVPAAVFVGNGYGKAAGFLQIAELGNMETPIVLTNTLGVGTGIRAIVDWTLSQPGNETVRSVNAVVGETNDGYLNDIRARRVTLADVRAAIDSAATGPVPEGSLGAGTGTRALGWKGGIGTASRILPESMGGYVLGALVQSNFGGILRIDGIPVGRRLGRYRYEDLVEERSDGSCMIVVATDAPLSSRNLERIARRAVLGLARTGSFMDNGSGDFVIAFSTGSHVMHEPASRIERRDVLQNDAMGPLFLATVEAVEEAILNSLLKATTVTGQRGRTVEAIPIDRLEEILSSAGGRSRARPAPSDR